MPRGAPTLALVLTVGLVLLLLGRLVATQLSKNLLRWIKGMLLSAERKCALRREGREGAAARLPTGERSPARSRGTVRLDGRRYRLLPCPADGRCFYHAVAAALNARVGAGGGAAWTAETVLETVRRTHPDVAATWAEDADATKTANVLRVAIHVWEGANGMWIRFGFEEDGVPTIRLINRYNVHFDALVALDPPPRTP